jgi:chemotaxis protein CheZ
MTSCRFIANDFVSKKHLPATCRCLSIVDGDAGPMHREIMTELRAIRAQMASPAGGLAAAGLSEESTAQKAAEAHALLETYRAQIEQCEKLKVELDLIHDAISRTKHEIAVLHGKSFNGERNGQGQRRTRRRGRRHRRGHPADSGSRRSDRPGGDRVDQGQLAGSAEAAQRGNQERVVSIFEACNFQDLTGQRISKVMTTMKFIENHITVMMDIWGGVDAIKAHAPPIVDEREGDARLLNGPKTKATSATPRRTTSTRCSTEPSFRGDAKRRTRESRDSPMCNCTSEVWC